jgi:hypothetical protein
VSDSQQTIKSLLDAATLSSGSRNHWGVAPDSQITPYVVMTNVASAPENTLSSGVPINNMRVQIDAYAVSYADAKTLGGAINGAMTANDFSIMLLEQGPLYQSDVKLHRMTQDYSVWTQRGS